MKYFNIGFIVGALLPTLAAASLMDKTVTLTVDNHTLHTLTFENVMNTNPGNVFTVTPTTVAPDTTVIITGTITQDFDLFAVMNFMAENAQEYSFFMVDPRNFHALEPTFMQNPHFQNIITAMTNGDLSARGLKIRSVAIDLRDAD
jgi:hypothetical protein